MCGARGLARRRAGIVALDLIILTVVVVPVLFTPVERFIRQRDGRVLDRTFMGTQLLSELGSARGTDFDALAAGNAVFRRDPRSVCRCRAVGVIKKLRAAQSKARADGAVADAEYLIGAVGRWLSDAYIRFPRSAQVEQRPRRSLLS